MTEGQANSWIFLAASTGCEETPASFKSILGLADGINHAVPTEKELQTAFKWLTANGFMTRAHKGFIVTAEGFRLLSEAASKSANVFDQWKYLEERFAQISN